jgi:hypothetical protein
MRENDLVAIANQTHDLRRDLARVGNLFANGPAFAGTDQRITADGKDHRFHSRTC